MPEPTDNLAELVRKLTAAGISSLACPKCASPEVRPLHYACGAAWELAPDGSLVLAHDPQVCAAYRAIPRGCELLVVAATRLGTPRAAYDFRLVDRATQAETLWRITVERLDAARPPKEPPPEPQPKPRPSPLVLLPGRDG
jgi:hypothetical protein